MTAKTIHSDGVWHNWVVEHAERPLSSVLHFLSEHIPEFTRDDIRKSNTGIWMDLRDYHLAHEDPNSGRYGVFKGLWYMFIRKYNQDSFYSDRIDRLLAVLVSWLEAKGYVFRTKPPGRGWIEDARSNNQ